MKKISVYDVPTRLFHWIFACFFLGAFLIAKNIDDESILYSYHMILGLTLAFIVILRIFWGIFGSRYARFSSFLLHPVQLVQYMKELFKKKLPKNLGHNPASSWATVVFIGLALGMAFSGFMMTYAEGKEVFEEIHELFANAFIIVAISHVAGVLFHTFKFRDGIGLSMIHGKKQTYSDEGGIDKTHPLIGFLFLSLVAIFVFYLNGQFNSETRQLNLFGTILQLGDGEEGKESGED